MTLVEFLLARIAEEKSRAEWVLEQQGDHKPFQPWAPRYYGLGDYDLLVIEPARVLAECEAKRRIVTQVVPQMREDQESIESEWGRTTDKVPGFVEPADRLLMLLALPYADHPDYREEWRP